VSLTYAYFGDVLKSERDPDTGDLFVYGKATGPDLDLDEQRCDPVWLRKAVPNWMEWGNVRAQHSAVAAGVGVELQQSGEDWYLKSLVVDEDSARKVEKKVYKGYSIGIKNARVVKDASAPGGKIVSGEIVEISLVDRPCNPTCSIAIAKAAHTGGDLQPVEVAKAVGAAGTTQDEEKSAEPDAASAAADEVAKSAEVSEATTTTTTSADGDEGLTPLQMAQAAMSGIDKSAGAQSAPIQDAAPDASDATSKAPGTGRQISPRALLDAQQRMRAEAYVTKALAGDLALRDLVKAAPDGDGNDESDDLTMAAQILVLLGRLICSEAEELATGDFREAFDIAILMDMVNALRCFIGREEEQSAGSFAPVDQDDCDTVFVALAAQPDLLKGKYSAEQLRQMLKDGKAIKNSKGQPSYPIGDKEDLDLAINAVGRGKRDHDAIRSYIMRRAKALGLTSMIPDSWAADGSIKPATKAAPTSDTPPAQAAVSDDQITQIVTKALAQARAADEERIKALEADLARIRATPIPGGPVLMTAPPPARTEHLTKADQYRAFAATCNDPVVARSYRELADREAART
jgi:hypothetical protein